MYKSFISLTGSTLYAERERWFSSAQNLSDGTNLYGRLSYSGFFKQTALAQTADAEWKFKYTNVFERALQILDKADVVIGELKFDFWSRKATLVVDGYGEIVFQQPSVWSSLFICSDAQRGTILEFRSKPFSKKNIVITVKDSVQHNKLLPLLVFLGVNLLVLRRKKAAMVASHG